MEKMKHPHDPGEWGADLVAHVGKELRFRLARRLRRVLGQDESLPSFVPLDRRPQGVRRGAETRDLRIGPDPFAPAFNHADRPPPPTRHVDGNQGQGADASGRQGIPFAREEVRFRPHQRMAGAEDRDPASEAGFLVGQVLERGVVQLGHGVGSDPFVALAHPEPLARHVVVLKDTHAASIGGPPEVTEHLLDHGLPVVRGEELLSSEADTLQHRVALEERLRHPVEARPSSPTSSWEVTLARTERSPSANLSTAFRNCMMGRVSCRA